MALDANGNYTPTEVPPAPPVTVPTIPNPPTTTDVYSSNNITQAVTNPAPTPNLSDPMGIYDFYNNSANVVNSQNAYQAANAELMNARNTAQARQLALENNPLESQGFIVGQQARAGQIDSQRLDALANATSVAQAAYLANKSDAEKKANLALGQRDQLTDLIVRNPGAGVTYTDTTETAAAKIQAYNVKREADAKKEAADKEKAAYKKSLKATAMSLGVKTTGNTKDLEKRIKNASKSAKEYEKTINDLKIQSAKADIANTYNTIANRNSTAASDKSQAAWEKNLFADIEAEKKKLMSKDVPANQWAASYNSLKAKYNLTDEDNAWLDGALGLNLRGF